MGACSGGILKAISPLAVRALLNPSAAEPKGFPFLCRQRFWWTEGTSSSATAPSRTLPATTIRRALRRTFFKWCLNHLDDKHIGPRELYRIFFYDCPPLTKKAHNPVSKKPVDFSKTKEAGFRLEIHSHLKKQRKVALRPGRLSDHAHWAIRPAVTRDLLSGKLQIANLSEDDVQYDVRQKGSTSFSIRCGSPFQTIFTSTSTDYARLARNHRRTRLFRDV